VCWNGLADARTRVRWYRSAVRSLALASLLALAACTQSSPSGPAASSSAPGANAPPLPLPESSAASIGYYQYPAIHGDVIVFTSEGDLWQVPRKGGTASRLTTHPGRELAAAVSPDGSTIAFSAAYEGQSEVYTMSRAGGTPVRRTFDGWDARVVGFAPDGAVLYATQRYSTLPETQLVRLDLAKNERAPLPLAQAADGSYAPDGKTLFFTRVPFQGSHTKRYRGGTAQSIWKYATGAPEAVPLTSDYDGTSKTPMWWSGRVYFLSDRDGTMNIWSMDENGHDLKQHTKHDGWDADQASLSEGRIAYKLGADLRVFDVASNADAAIDVRIASDFDQQREAWVKKPLEYLTSIALAPKGDRVALTARGQVFVAPVKQGRFVEVTRKPGVRYRRATFMPDGKELVALSDESGEVELWKLAANGVGQPEKLTSGAKVLRWDAVPAPGGKWIAHHDKDRQLWIWNTEKKTDKLVATSKHGNVADIAWSLDGKWLAYSAPAANRFDQIFLHDPEDGATIAVTSDRYDSYGAAFSPDGEWLYFLSDRRFKSVVGAPWGPRQPDPYVANPTEIYALALAKDARFPFAPADELHADAPKRAAKVKAATVDRDGIVTRLRKVPVPSGRFASLQTDGERLYWISVDNATEPPKRKLVTAAIGRDKPHVKTLMEDVREYQVSADRKKLLVRREKDGESDLFVFDAGEKAPDKLDEAKLDLGKWTFSFDPREQWKQMFVEAWRLERDYFYDRGMHGLDWPKVRDKYLPLVDRVRSRDELNDLLAQMVSELSALHIFVRRGDLRRAPDEIEVASLGAEVARDVAAGGWRVTKVYVTDPDSPQTLSPLRRDGASVEVGDVIQSVNGTATLSVIDPGSLLRNQAGRQVLLRVVPSKGAARDVIVVPMRASEARDLRYDDWEYERRRRVEERGKGAIGYVHLRAMSGDDYAQWARDYYPVFQRQGLIVDVRHNRGGNIDSWILGKLLRKPWFYWQDRVGDPYWNMQYAFRGHVVVLVDAFTASDGEAFAEGARRLGIGKVIGTRTWGGEIWLGQSNVLVDNGIATAAENGVYGPEGQWLIEGRGVEPDIVVDNLPRATFDGRDEQLEAAMKHLEERIAAEPIKDVPPPPFPRK